MFIYLSIRVPASETGSDLDIFLMGWPGGATHSEKGGTIWKMSLKVLHSYLKSFSDVTKSNMCLHIYNKVFNVGNAKYVTLCLYHVQLLLLHFIYF